MKKTKILTKVSDVTSHNVYLISNTRPVRSPSKREMLPSMNGRGLQSFAPGAVRVPSPLYTPGALTSIELCNPYLAIAEMCENALEKCCLDLRMVWQRNLAEKKSETRGL